MTQQKEKASPVAKGDAFENVVHFPAINGDETNNSLLQVQQHFIARRARLAPVLARIVAELAYYRRAA